MENPAVNTNPWKGLNFYKEGEIIYGRNSEIESLSQYILNNTQTVLYGKSGIGKSSILNAGVFPIARRHGLIPVGIRLDHSTSVSYIRQIENAIVSSGVDVHEIQPAMSESSETLWEYLHRNIFFDQDGNRAQLLLVLDQFEEIFTLQKDEKKKLAFFDELADLINDVTPLYIVNANKSQQTVKDGKAKEVEGSLDDFDIDLDIDEAATESSSKYLQKVDYHVVFTLREDFLSFLERYTKFIPAMKSNRYALLPLNEEQAAEIIMKPRKGLVEQDVAKLIIQKVTGRTDFSLGDEPEIDVDAAILSLYLSRIYIKKKDSDAIITAELVNQFSDDIIKDFYEESVADIPVAEIEKIEDQLLTYDGRRNNVSRNDLVSEGISEGVIDTLVEDRKLLRQFSYRDDIRVEFMHDILCPVVDARISQREETKKKEEERIRQEEEREKLLRKNHRRVAIAIGSTVVLSLLVFLYFLFFKIPFSNCYASFTCYNGWPVGLGSKLNSKDKEGMVVHYRLTRHGILKSFTFMGFKYSNPNFKVEVLNKKGQHSTNILVESPLVSLAETDGTDPLSRKFASKQLLVSSWLYTADEYGNVSHQTAYDMDKKMLYSVQYYRETRGIDNEDIQTLWMNYVDEEGKSLRLRSNGADRMRVTQRNGYFTKCFFFNETGTPQQNSRKAYGYRYDINPQNGCRIAILPLDEYGDTIKDQSLRFKKFDQYLRWTDANESHAEYGANHVIYNMGNRIDTLQYDDDGHQMYRSELTLGHQLRTFSYDVYGNLKSSKVFKFYGNKKGVLVYSVVCNYYTDSDGLTEKTEYAADASVKYRREVHHYENDTHTTIYYCGNDLSLMKESNKEGEDYCKLVSRTEITDSTRLFIATYYGIDSEEKEIELRREETLYSRDNDLPLRKISYEGGKRFLSLEYEIEDNLIVGQHVIGLTGDTIRCPLLDDNGLTYYRKKFVRNFNGDIVAAKAINEYGEVSMITYSNKRISITVVPGDEIMKEGSSDVTFGMGVYKYSASPVDEDLKVEYLHITDTTGSYYQSGLRDGDIILNSDEYKVLIARLSLKHPSVEGKGSYFKILPPFYPRKGEKGMETYPVYYTKSEMEKLQESIKNAR